MQFIKDYSISAEDIAITLYHITLVLAANNSDKGRKYESKYNELLEAIFTDKPALKTFYDQEVQTQAQLPENIQTEKQKFLLKFSTLNKENLIPDLYNLLRIDYLAKNWKEGYDFLQKVYQKYKYLLKHHTDIDLLYLEFSFHENNQKYQEATKFLNKLNQHSKSS